MQPHTRKSAKDYSSRKLTFRDAVAKAEYLADRLHEDIRDPRVQAVAAYYLRAFPDPRERCAALLRYVQFCIDYHNDPRVEILDSPGAAIDRGYADCDCKMRLFRALCHLAQIICGTVPVFGTSNPMPHIKDAVTFDPEQRPESWILLDPTNQNSTLDDEARNRPQTNHWGPR